jgi:hypothetical protein
MYCVIHDLLSFVMSFDWSERLPMNQDRLFHLQRFGDEINGFWEIWQQCESRDVVSRNVKIANILYSQLIAVIVGYYRYN